MHHGNLPKRFCLLCYVQAKIAHDGGTREKGVRSQNRQGSFSGEHELCSVRVAMKIFLLLLESFRLQAATNQASLY